MALSTIANEPTHTHVDWLDGRGMQPIDPEPPLNTSGFEPLDLRVLVLPDSAEKVTAGGIILPDTTGERKEYAMQWGTLIATGVNAWEEAASRSTRFVRPKPGDRIVFAKHGGEIITGRDGVKYRLMNDEDVIGTVTEEG